MPRANCIVMCQTLNGGPNFEWKQNWRFGRNFCSSWYFIHLTQFRHFNFIRIVYQFHICLMKIYFLLSHSKLGPPFKVWHIHIVNWNASENWYWIWRYCRGRKAIACIRENLEDMRYPTIGNYVRGLSKDGKSPNLENAFSAEKPSKRKWANVLNIIAGKFSCCVRKSSFTLRTPLASRPVATLTVVSGK